MREMGVPSFLQPVPVCCVLLFLCNRYRIIVTVNWSALSVRLFLKPRCIKRSASVLHNASVGKSKADLTLDACGLWCKRRQIKLWYTGLRTTLQKPTVWTPIKIQATLDRYTLERLGIKVAHVGHLILLMTRPQDG